MLDFKDIVLRLKKVVKISNVYECARPILLLLGLFGVGPSNIMNIDGVYLLRNTRYNIITAILISILTPYYLLWVLKTLFNGELRSLLIGVVFIVSSFTEFLMKGTVNAGFIMTCYCCKDLDKVFQILNNIDTRLQQQDIKIKHWKITLQVTVLGLVTVNYKELVRYLYIVIKHHQIFTLVFQYVVLITYNILFHLYYVWVILFLLIIYERFVSINKLILENASVTNIRIVGSGNLRDEYLLRRISVARDMDEQLSKAIVIYSNVFRYIIAGILLNSIIETLFNVISFFFAHTNSEYGKQLFYMNIYTHCIRIVIIISICEAYKNERQVLKAKLRHLISHETDRRITHQVQQYIMYNATSVTGLIDFQFTDVDNVLLFTIIDIIISNMLIIYSYDR